MKKAVALDDEASSYPFHDVPIHVVVTLLYMDWSVDGAANVLGRNVRRLMHGVDGLVQNST